MKEIKTIDGTSVEIVKDNFINRLFKASKVNKCINDIAVNQHVQDVFEQYLIKLDGCITLEEVMLVHKKMWRDGLNTPDIGPNPYGMYRTSDINTMTIKEVYLGGIWGLFTNNIEFFNNHDDEIYGCNGYGIDPSIRIYTIVRDQYIRHLKANIYEMVELAKKNIRFYQSMGY